MEKSLIEAIRSRRRELENPYAYIDEIENFDDIHLSRKRLENPHAYSEDIDRMNSVIGRFDGLSMKPQNHRIGILAPKPKKYSDSEIEQFARQLQRRLWRDLLASGENEPLIALNPFLALQWAGYQVEQVESLGLFNSGSRPIQIAGTIDGIDRIVQISSQYPSYVQNFTAAHELGHAQLHEGMALHRDRPLDGTQYSRDHLEYAADKFAAFFLMPRKLVISIFESIFSKAPFSLTDDTRFALNSSSGGSDKRVRFSNLRDLSIHLSSTGTYNGRQFLPLSTRFRVSNQTMAIRLEELQLINFN